MATIVVTTGRDRVDAGDGETSLREAIERAVLQSAGDDRIVFARGVTNLQIASSLVIDEGEIAIRGDRDRDGWGDVTISGTSRMSLLRIGENARVELSGVHFSDVEIEPIREADPDPRPPRPDDPGADGEDGSNGEWEVSDVVAAPIVNFGELSLRRVSFSDITVVAPDGNPGGPGGHGSDGAPGANAPSSAEPGGAGTDGGDGGEGGRAGQTGGYAAGAIFNIGQLRLAEVGIGTGVVAHAGDGGAGGEGGQGGWGGAGGAGGNSDSGAGSNGGAGGDGGDGGEGGDGGAGGGATNGVASFGGAEADTPVAFASRSEGSAGRGGEGALGGDAGQGGAGGAGGIGSGVSATPGMPGSGGFNGDSGFGGLEGLFEPFWLGDGAPDQVTSLVYADASRGAAGEGRGLDVTVVRLGASDASVTVDWTLRFDDGAVADDFDGPVRGSVTFGPSEGGGEAETVRLGALADGIFEGGEGFTFRLRGVESDVSEAVGFGSREVALRIRDGDGATRRADTLTGTERGDTIDGLGGDDTIRGVGGADELTGGKGDDEVAGGSGRDGLVGGGGDDALTGGAGGDRLEGESGEDRLEGGQAADLLAGGRGADALEGGSGEDVFRFASARDAGVGRSRDEIVDFTRGDRIDLSRIDADPERGGDQAFALVDGDPFSGRAGELRYEAGVLRGDVDGDAIADFEIALADAPNLRVADFLL